MAWQHCSGSEVARRGHAAVAGDLAKALASGAEHVISRLEELAALAELDPGLETMATELSGLLKLAREKLDPIFFEKLEGCVTAAAEALKRMSCKHDALAERVAFLEALVAQQQEEQQEQQTNEDRQIILLGQLAYTMDEAVTSFLYGPSSRPISLRDLVETMGDDDVDEKTAAKWQKVVAYAQQQGVSISRLAAASGPLRQQRFDQAHGTYEERRRTTPGQLREWAGNSLQGNVDKVLKFLTPLTLPQQPLVPRADVAAVFNNAGP